MVRRYRLKRSRCEAEVIVRLDYADNLAHVCVCQWPSMARRMKKLYGPPEQSTASASQRWLIPLKAISFQRLKLLSGAPSNGATLPSGLRRTRSSRFQKRQQAPEAQS